MVILAVFKCTHKLVLKIRTVTLLVFKCTQACVKSTNGYIGSFQIHVKNTSNAWQEFTQPFVKQLVCTQTNTVIEYWPSNLIRSTLLLSDLGSFHEVYFWCVKSEFPGITRVRCVFFSVFVFRRKFVVRCHRIVRDGLKSNSIASQHPLVLKIFFAVCLNVCGAFKLNSLGPQRFLSLTLPGQCYIICSLAGTVFSQFQVPFTYCL